MPSNRAPDPEALEALGRRLLELDLSFSSDADRLRRRAARLITDYLVPRLRHPQEPAAVVVVGPSGVGKSELVGALTSGSAAGTGSDVVPRFVDAPPPDMVDDHGDSLAHGLIDAADACVLVVSAARYGDASAFALAQHARDLGVPTVVVANRLGTEDERIVVDLTGKLLGRDLVDDGDDAVVTLPDEVPSAEEAEARVAPVRERLQARVGGPARSLRVQRSLDEVERLLSELGVALRHAEEQRSALHTAVEVAYRMQVEALAAEVRSGRFAAADVAESLDALTTAIVRHAGRAATRAADVWAESSLSLVTDRLYGVGEDTEAEARVAVERWLRSAPVPRLSIRALLAGARSLWVKLALEPRPHLSRAEERWVQRRPGYAEAARRGLREAITAALGADSRRFHTLLPPPVTEEMLEGLRLEESRG